MDMHLLHPIRGSLSSNEWVILSCHLTRLIEAKPTTLKELLWNHRQIPWMRE